MGYNKMKKMGREKNIGNTQKFGKRIKIKLLGMAAVLLALPVYGISNELFKLAVCRDNSVSLFQRKGVRKLAERLNEVIAGRGRKKWGDGKEPAGGKRTADEKVPAGLGFADFTGEMEEGKTWFQSQKKERIAMTSHDGLKLVAYYLPAPKESRRVLILMHGYRNEGIVWDFSGLVKFYHEQGYHLLVPHQRAHGESEGEHICFGVKERYDLAQWTEYISRRFERRCSIFLSGISMGGATVLMAAGLKLPGQVKGIIADCGYTSPWDIFAYVLGKDCHLPKFPFLYAADYICYRRAGFHFQECSAVESLRGNRIPVLFIHGGRDAFVPARMSWKNYEACAAEKEIFIVDRAAHGASHLVEPEEYRRRVVKFMEKWSDGN